MHLSDDHRPSKLFLAEGDAEALFFESLFNRRAFNANDYCVYCFRGIKNFTPTLRFLKKEPNFPYVNSLGIMLDANNDPESRLESVKINLASIDFVDESISFDNNNIAEHEGLRIGIFLSPGNSKAGTIETLAIKEIETKQESKCLSQLKVCLKDISDNILSDKALTQIFLSIKKPGLCGTGRGFEAGILDVEHNAYETVVRIFTSI